MDSGFSQHMQEQKRINDLYENYMSTKRESFTPIRDSLNNVPENKKFMYENSMYLDKGQYFMDASIGKVNADVAREFAKIGEQADKSYGMLFQKGDSLFFVAHGTNKGQVALGRKQYNVQEALSALNVRDIIKQNNISEIFTLNCYGGMQSGFNIDGVPVQSMHKSFKPVMGSVYDLNADSLQNVFEIKESMIDSSKQYGIAVNTQVGNGTFGDITGEAKLSLMRNDSKPATLVKSTQEVKDQMGQYETDKFKKQWEERKKAKQQSQSQQQPSSVKQPPQQPKQRPQQPSKPKQNPQPKQKPMVEAKTRPQMEPHTGPKLKSKKINGGGKAALVADIIGTIANTAMTGVMNDVAKNSNKIAQKTSGNVQKIASQLDDIDPDYIRRIASDVSSYRYGKKMTGFI